MKTIGFPISHKENEKRRAILPRDLEDLENPQFLYFEQGYGGIFSIDDSEYEKYGCHVVSREETLKQDIICDPKIGDADYFEQLHPGQTLFGWVHAVQNKAITDHILDKKLTAICWEDMYHMNRHSFWHNNELAGEAAIMHAYQIYGAMPYDTKVALIGRGNVAKGALRVLTLLGADVTMYDKRTENLFKSEMNQYDVIVNALLWDVNRKDHIINISDLAKLKKDAMIVDISCDRAGAIESSIPTTIQDPVYYTEGVLHYVVDHTPSLFFKSSTYGISKEVAKHLDNLITENHDEIIEKAVAIKNGRILDQRIIHFQGRK